MSEYYAHSTFPSNGSVASASAMRAELELIEAGTDKLPTLSGNGSKIVAINSGGTGMEAITTTGTGNGVRATSPTIATPTFTGTTTAAAIAASGNVTIGGTLGVTGATSLTGALTTSSSASIGSSLTVGSDLAVNVNKFNVTASSGNTAIAGTLGVTGDVAVNTNKFTVTASSGNTTIAGTLAISDNTSIIKSGNAETNMLQVQNTSTGNAAGAILSMSNSAGSGTITKYGSGHATLANVLDINNAQNAALRLLANNTLVASFTSGATALTGTLSVTGATTLAALSATTGTFSSNVAITGTLSATGNAALGGATNVNSARLAVKGAFPQFYLEDSGGGANGTLGAIGWDNGAFKVRRYLDNGTLVGTWLTIASDGATSITGNTAITGTLSATGTITGDGGTTVNRRFIAARGSDDTNMRVALGWNSLQIDRDSSAVGSVQSFDFIFNGTTSRTTMTLHGSGKVSMPALPTSSAGLSAGDLWNDAGTLKVA